MTLLQVRVLESLKHKRAKSPVHTRALFKPVAWHMSHMIDALQHTATCAIQPWTVGWLSDPCRLAWHLKTNTLGGASNGINQTYLAVPSQPKRQKAVCGVLEHGT